jgi:hypothetical protein
MSVLGDLLFFPRNGTDLDSLLRRQRDQVVPDIVARLPQSDFQTGSDEVLLQKVIERAEIRPLEVAFDNPEANVEEITLVVQDVFGERARVPGLKATKTFRFLGDGQIWHLRPNSYDMNPPRGTVTGNSIVIGVEVRVHEVEQAASYIDGEVAKIKEYLGRQDAQIESFNQSLSSHILPQLGKRRIHLKSAEYLLKKIQ